MALTSIVWFCWLPLHCNAVERKVLEVYQISSTKETKQAHQIQSIMLQASGHSKNLHICFKSFNFLLLKTKCSFIPPRDRTVKHQTWGTYVQLKTTCLSHCPTLPALFYNLGVRRKGSEHSCHFRTTGTFLSSVATLTWCEAMLNVTA